jgi:hypothetical protein
VLPLPNKKKDYEVKLWKSIKNKSSFFNLSIKDVNKLLENDLSIAEGLVILKELKYPEAFERSKIPQITEKEIESKYEERTEQNGLESRIFFDINNEKYIYKLTDIHPKSPNNNRFNEVLMYYILQDYLFKDFKYKDLKICEDKFFVCQRYTKSLQPELDSIEKINLYDKKFNLCMKKAKYKFNDNTKFWQKDINGIIVIINDLMPNNCRINKLKLEVFDSIIRIDYGKE